MMIAGSEGNLSCRSGPERLLITPAGKCKGRLRPDDLVEIDHNGELLHGSQPPSSEYRLHTHIYRRYPRIGAIVHVHSRYATAFALSGRTIDASALPEFQHLFGRIPLVDYADPGSSELAARVAALAGDHHTLLLERHGLVASGADLEEALDRVDMAEQCAAVAWIARALIASGGNEREMAN
jgi:L-fuculose-phosphate aldolase